MQFFGFEYRLYEWPNADVGKVWPVGVLGYRRDIVFHPHMTLEDSSGS